MSGEFRDGDDGVTVDGNLDGVVGVGDRSGGGKGGRGGCLHETEHEYIDVRV